MIKERVNIKELAKKYTEEWLSELTVDNVHDVPEAIEKYAREYLKKRLDDALDAAIGIDRSWSNVSMKRDGLMESMSKAALPRLRQDCMDFFALATIELTAKDKKDLLGKYEESLKYALRQGVVALAQKHAKELLTHELDSILDDDEFSYFLEKKLRETP